ncbi:hypothetical protein [Sinorhizobium americanum]|nr:hypothetical protein [Sinorhizobium americanum]
MSVDEWFAASIAFPRASARYDAGGVARKGVGWRNRVVLSVERGVRDAS